MELESQVAKIQLGPEDGNTGFVFVSAEKLRGENNECFIVAEITDTTPELLEPSKQICLSILSAIKRTFSKTNSPETFESSLSNVNEELSKLITLGLAHWVEKFNCIIAVKQGHILHISTVGKISALLFRENELTDLTCSPEKSNAIKTFENFASGKIQLHDLILFSTSQLFNLIALDRLQGLLHQKNFLKSTAHIVDILKANSGGKIPLGAIIAEEAIAGTLPEVEINLEEYIETSGIKEPGLIFKLKSFVFAIINPNKKLQFKNFARQTKKINVKTLNFSKILTFFSNLFKKTLVLSPKNIKAYSPQKKFFFISACVLCLALIFQLGVAIYFKGNTATHNKIQLALTSAQKNLNDAESALLYRDDPAARQFLNSALTDLNGLTPKTSEQKTQLKNTLASLDAIKSKLEKTVEISSENLGILANNTNLHDFPEHLAVSSVNGYVSYNKQNRSIKDNEIKLNSKTIYSQRISPNLTAIYDGENLKLWDYKNNTLSENFKTLVPSEADAVNLAYYSTKQRLYMLNKAQNQLTSFALLGNTIAKPENSLLLSPEDSKAIVDFAIDGSIYLLKPNAIIKYYAGTKTEFKTNLIDPLTNAKKIFTSAETKNIYLLESNKKRVIVLNKQGNLIYNLTNPDWNNLQDFVVDEKNKTVYLLNDSSLLKFTLP
jgi:hypothetical protein